MIVHANLDQEARWARSPLPARVLRRISAAALLLAAFAPPGEPVEIWTPAAADPARLRLPREVTVRVGAPRRADLAWADPAARAVNDRRFALALAGELGIALPGARALGSLAELDALFAARAPRRWVCKAAWSAAGRDRCLGEGPPTPDRRTRIARLIERAGAVVIEPWLDRRLDVGVCGVAGGLIQPPHGLATDARGGFAGIDLTPPPLLPAEAARLAEVAARVSAALAAAGYAGPFGIDAFVHDDAGVRRLHPLCEINARHTFGHVARALGAPRLGFGAPPPGATVLVAPAPDDPVTAWTLPSPPAA